MEGFEICSKCKGEKVTTEYPSKENNLQSPMVSQCDKCGGTGQVDWVTNAMTSSNFPTLSYNNMPGTNIASFQPPNEITFFPDGQTEALKICGNGDFFVKGKKVTNDKKVYKAFVDFLKGQGVYI